MLTEEMKANRCIALMGSHAAIIEGVGRWGDAHWLFNVLQGNISDDIKETIPMMLGNQNEEVARKLYTEATGNKVRQIRRTLWHKNHKFIGGHPDGIVVGDKNRGIEIKCVFQRAERDWEDGVPAYHVPQVMQYALVTGRLKWDFSVLFMAHGRHKIYELEFTKKDLDDLCRKLVKFWIDVQAGREPEVTDRSAPTLKELWKTTDPESIKVADDAIANYVQSRKSYKEMYEGVKSSIDLVENRIRKYMQGSETLINANGDTIATYRMSKSGSRRFNFNIKKEKKNGNHNADQSSRQAGVGEAVHT
jgi:predicted phage-related endonuclease